MKSHNNPSSDTLQFSLNFNKASSFIPSVFQELASDFYFILYFNCAWLYKYSIRMAY